MTGRFDIAVVGRGLMGTAAARYLAQMGHRVALIGPSEPQNRATHDGPFGSHHDAGRITRGLAEKADWAPQKALPVKATPDEVNMILGILEPDKAGNNDFVNRKDAVKFTFKTLFQVLRS